MYAIDFCTANLDAVCYVPKTAAVGAALSILQSTLQQQVGQLLSLLEEDVNAVSAVHHFLPGSFVSHVVPVCYALPAGDEAAADFEANDTELQKQRAKLHSTFMLPDDSPLLRTGSALTLTAAGKQYDRLLNVHEACPDSGVPGGTKSLVRGPYLYYHYMQDKFNDKGWGCAYRSLQTIWSWFLLNGYTLKPVPSHKDIQECLVKIGDKQRSFIGSKQWIGSTEVGFCLDEMLDVTFRCVTSSTGPGLAEKGRELAKHFDEVGTPIMMGGGALAFTLLGVDFNSATGEIKFLILVRERNSDRDNERDSERDSDRDSERDSERDNERDKDM
jgi:hypothetical protein